MPQAARDDEPENARIVLGLLQSVERDGGPVRAILPDPVSLFDRDKALGAGGILKFDHLANGAVART